MIFLGHLSTSSAILTWNTADPKHQSEVLPLDFVRSPPVHLLLDKKSDGEASIHSLHHRLWLRAVTFNPSLNVKKTV